MDFGTLPSHPNILDGNFNLVHHFIRGQIFQTNEKGPVDLGADLAEKNGKVKNDI